MNAQWVWSALRGRGIEAHLLDQYGGCTSLGVGIDYASVVVAPSDVPAARDVIEVLWGGPDEAGGG